MTAPKSKHTVWIFAVTAVVCAALDLWSKMAVFAMVEAHPFKRVVLIPERFEFLIRHNDAGIWSIGRDMPHSNLFLAVFSGIAVVAISVWGIFYLPHGTQLLAGVTGAILGGAGSFGTKASCTSRNNKGRRRSN